MAAATLTLGRAAGVWWRCATGRCCARAALTPDPDPNPKHNRNPNRNPNPSQVLWSGRDHVPEETTNNRMELSAVIYALRKVL